VAGGWRRLHNEELHNLYTSPNIIMVMRSRRMCWYDLVVHVEEMRNAYEILFRSPDGKRPLRISRLRWKDIRMDLKKLW
jgi:hypothetical protein